MVQTKAVAIKARQKMIIKYGGEDGYRAAMRAIGHKGGLATGTNGGFAHSTANPSLAGAKGGARSRRGYMFVKETMFAMHYIDKATGEKVKFHKK